LEQTYLSAFLLGLFGSLHCIGMCGSISSVLTFSLPQKTREQLSVLASYLSFYNLGRLLSYTIAGTLAGAFGSQLLYNISPQNGHKILLLLSTMMLVAVGLYLAGWFPKLAYIERIGVPVWKKIEPLGRKLLPLSGSVLRHDLGLATLWTGIFRTINCANSRTGCKRRVILIFFRPGHIAILTGFRLFCW